MELEDTFEVALGIDALVHEVAQGAASTVNSEDKCCAILIGGTSGCGKVQFS